MLAILGEDLDPAVAAIADEQTALRIHRQRVRVPKLAMITANGTPLHEEIAVLVELDDAIVAGRVVAVRDEDVAIGRDQHIRGFVENIGAIARDAFLAESHQQFALVH